MSQHPGTQDAEELCLSSLSCDWWIQNVNFHNPGELRTGNHCLMLSVAQVPESLGSRLRERASILQSSLASSSLAVLLSPLLLALLLSSPKTYSPATAGSCWVTELCAGPHLDVEVVHSLGGCWWLTFMTTVLSIAIFILTQEEHERAQNEAETKQGHYCHQSFMPTLPHTRPSCCLGG